LAHIDETRRIEQLPKISVDKSWKQVTDFFSKGNFDDGTRKEKRKSNKQSTTKQYTKEQYKINLILFLFPSHSVQPQRRIQVDSRRSSRGKKSAGQSGVHQDLCYLSL
jgi:hypothetical protein